MKRSRRVFLTMMGVAALTSPIAITSALAQPVPVPPLGDPRLVPPPPLDPLLPRRRPFRRGGG